MSDIEQSPGGELIAQGLSESRTRRALDAGDTGRDRGRARELFRRIEPELYRYPAVDPGAFRRRVEEVLGSE